MKCQDAENEILSREGEAIPSLELKAHLRQCARCADLMINSVEIDSVFQNASVLEPSPFLWTRIERRLEAAPAARGWFSWIPAPASLALASLILFSAFLARFEPAVRPVAQIDFKVLLEEMNLNSSTANSNPFLMAHAGVKSESNPFLDAMLPRDENPFSNPRVR